jgi:hypothetical protein
MELAQPRWSEVPDELSRLVSGATARAPHAEVTADWEKVADEAKLAGAARDQFRGQVERLRTYLGLREAGKHYLLLGYAVIRRALVELDRRLLGREVDRGLDAVELVEPPLDARGTAGTGHALELEAHLLDACLRYR